jgi:hypothetical protein
MPGRMGGKTRTMQNLYVMRVDTSLNLIFVKVGTVIYLLLVVTDAYLLPPKLLCFDAL